MTRSDVAPLLSVRDLRTEFATDEGRFAAVDGVSFDLAAGEVLGIVGESGSGKSVTALSILRLVPDPPGRITNGSITFDGESLLGRSERAMRRIRGAKISMIFQEPMSSLNPVFTIGDQIMETVRRHQRLGKHEARRKAAAMLDLVGIPSAAGRLDDYPHELSGGMRQRVMIAIALACNPKLLLADEPTTALDVTIQAQILDLLKSLQAELDMSVILITHDLGVVAEIVDRVIVMYAGRIVEEAGVDDAFEAPLHPYTEGLLGSIPSLEDDVERLPAIPGVVPNPFELPQGCPYAPRCGYVRPPCRAGDIPLFQRGPARRYACIRHHDYEPAPARGAAA